MAGEKVVKNISGVYCRLFDHRPMIQGECKYFVREFEGKRNDREVERLKEADHKVRQIEDEIPLCIENAKHFEELKEKLRTARQSCHNILVKEEEELHHDRRVQIKEDCEKDWEVFQLEMTKEEENIRKEFEEEAEKLKQKYATTEPTAH